MKKETKWSIDLAHSQIEFKIRHLMIAHVKGSFRVFDANVITTGKDFSTAQVDLWIDVSSVSTGDAKRDQHLKSEEFFDAAHHHQITFTASSVLGPDQDGHAELWGDLTIKGITRHQKLMVKAGGLVNDPWGNERAGFEVSGTLNRSDFGLTWNTTLESGGVMVSDEVALMCEVEFINTTNDKAPLQLEVTARKEASL